MKPIDAMMDAVAWRETETKPSTDGMLYATHEGELEIDGHRLRCYRLNDGRAVFDADDLESFFGEWLVV